MKRALAAVLAACFVLAAPLALAQGHADPPDPAADEPEEAVPEEPEHDDPTVPGHHADPDHAAAAHDATEHAPEGLHTERGHGAEHHGPAPINWTDIGDKDRPAYVALLVNFGLLIGLYYTLGKKPIAQALKQRRVSIGKAIEDAQQMLRDAKERAKKYQADLKNADADATTAKAALIAAGKGDVERALVEANERADRLQRDAARLVEQERKQVHHDLLIETVELAVAEAAQVLEKSVTAQDHARFAEDLLAELSRVPGARPPVPSRGAGGAS